MVFSSHVFLFWFLPLALAGYYATPRPFKNLVLTLFSYVFYAWATPYFILLIAWSTGVDYCCGNFIGGYWRLGRAGSPGAAPGWQRKLFLGLSLTSNIGILFFFKYFVFAEENLNTLLGLFGRDALPVLSVALPAGISFYTFESISYNVDIYLGRARPAIAWVVPPAGAGPLPLLARVRAELKALSAFACYITQFPHLVAGPIIRYQDLEAQIHLRTHSLRKFGGGVFFFALGLAKKILIANPVGFVADMAFGSASLHPLDAWYGLFSYAFQIYFDFSGYSDMAVGLGLMLGFEFPKNFDAPYQAQSLTDFWRRWHISLSTWLRDYLYIPLGGNRHGPWRTYVNLMTVMVLGGLWHGASWNFLVWGGIHGGWLAFERVLGKKSVYTRAPAPARVALTFLVVNLAWVFFRAPDLPAAWQYLRTLCGAGEPSAASDLVRGVFYSQYHLFWFAVAATLSFFGVTTWDLARRITPVRAVAALLLLAWSVLALGTQSFSPFLYFRF